MSTAMWLRRLVLASFALCLAVVVLGAYVRLTAAGLGCPDWPGCYGHLTPGAAAESGAAFDLGKAWREMAHRYAAATLGLTVLAIAGIAIATRSSARLVSTGYALLLLATVVAQGLLGMLTVTWKLKPLAVTLHLLLGMTTLALLWWLYLRLTMTGSPRPAEADARPRRRARAFVAMALAALGVQIALGGWTSSNYAAVACPDFPTCQGAWWPRADFGEAFVLWRGLEANYEGGVLAHPARIAIHLTHRVGALVTAVAVLAAVLAVLRQPALRQARAAAFAFAGALVLQLAIGVAMVLEAFPLGLAAAHNAGAALLALAGLALYRRIGAPA